MRKALYAFVVMLFVTGCMRNEQAMEVPTIMTVKPVELFEGESAKFKPFMGTMSGAFKLRYKGEKPSANLDLEIWQKGKAAVPAGSVGDLFFNSDGKKNKEVEIIVAIEDDANAKLIRIKLGTVYDSGSGATTFTVPLEMDLKARGLAYDNKPRSFAAEGDVAVPVWAMFASSSNGLRAADLESLKDQEWALVVLFRPTN